MFSSCLKFFFASGDSNENSYDTVNNTSGGPEFGLKSIPISNSSDPNVKQGWIHYISRAALVPIKSKVWATIYQDFFYCHEKEKNLRSVVDTDEVVIILALSGATIKAGLIGFPYGITVKGHNVSAELDADTLVYQKEWISALKAAIEAANINAMVSGEEEVNAGVRDWYNEKVKARQDAIIRLRQGTPMRKHFLTPLGTRKDHQRVISVDEIGKTLSWNSSNSSNNIQSTRDTNELNDKVVNIDEIDEILEGTRTKVLSSLSSEPNRSVCCWSIVTASRTYDFEASAPSERDRWVTSLRTIINVNKLDAQISKHHRLTPYKRLNHQILKHDSISNNSYSNSNSSSSSRSGSKK